MDNKELKDRIKFKIIMSEINNEKKTKRDNIKVMQSIGVAACFVFLIGGITFSDAISEKIYDIYNFRKQYNIETKLPEEVVKDEERLEEVTNNKNAIIPWNENAADVVEVPNLEVKITDLAMDNYYLSFESEINFSEEVTEKMPLEDIYIVRFPDLVIKDENENILFCMEENKLKEIFGTENLDDIRNNPKYCISEVTYYSFDNYEKLGSNPYKMTYHLNTILPSVYPKSKKLTFEFTKIALDSEEAAIGIDQKHYLHQDQTLTITGNWKIDVDVSSKYYNREDVILYEIVQSDENPKNQLLYCYYKDGLMHADFNLESEERRNGPWDSVKLSDMLSEINVEPMIKNYIIYKYSSSDTAKERDFWQDEVFYVEEYYIENSNGQKSKPNGIYKRVGDTLESASLTAWSPSGVRNGILKSGLIPAYHEPAYNDEWVAPDGVIFDMDEELLTDQMTIKIKYLGKNIEFKIQKMKGDR